MEGAFAKPTDQVLAHFGVDAATGLTQQQIQDLRAKYGKNGEFVLLDPPRLLVIWN